MQGQSMWMPPSCPWIPHLVGTREERLSMVAPSQVPSTTAGESLGQAKGLCLSPSSKRLPCVGPSHFPPAS